MKKSCLLPPPNEEKHLYINKKSELFDFTQATIAIGSKNSHNKDINKKKIPTKRD
tara:strand:- start:579 stop:743 length:165 start_codon:yes stop_codon:yes gene_type:complete